jgi:hypothetical protein
MQFNIEGNDRLDQVLVIRKLKLDSPVKEGDLTIPAEIWAQYRHAAKLRDLESVPLGNAREPATELAPGLVFIPGSRNITLVRQEDGIVILEAPISSGYPAQVIAEARHRFLGLPPKAVITTSDSWPHLAGVRQYVADGIPIYALDLNEPIPERVIEDPRRSKPDSLSRSRRKPVAPGAWEGDTRHGPNRLEIYPLRGETSERQMMVYFPEHHLLYGSDPFQQLPDGTYFYPQTVTELQGAVAREHLNVDRFFMVHIAPNAVSRVGQSRAGG